MKSYFCSNLDCPFKIQWYRSLLPYSVNVNWGGGRVAPWPIVNEPGFAYGALFYNVILPMQPRWNKGSILLTCGSEIGPLRAGSIGAARADFNGDEVLSWQFSGPKGMLQSFLEVPLSPRLINCTNRQRKS
jgi:hypothetical protein